GLERDASNNFGLIASCTLNQVLKWNGTGWSCAADSDSDVWSAITGGINYPGGVNKVGINDSDLSDTAALLQVGGSASIANDLGVLGSGSFGGTVSANSGVFTRGGNVVAQSAFSSNWKYEPGGFSAGHSAPRCNAAGTDGKLTCDISDSTQDCGGLVYDIGTDPGASPVTCYDWYVSLAGSNEQRAYNRVASATTGGWVSGMSGYSDTISLGGDSTGDDLEVRINAPSNRNKISFTNQTTGGLAAIRAGGLTLQNGTEADGKVLVSDATGNASWADPVISGGGSSTESLWSGPSLTGSIYYNGGNVGIGTANPGAKLDVSGIIMGGGGVANLDPAGTIDDVLFNNLKNSGKFAIGWNRTAGGGETDFISSRNGGSTGGFRFYDLANDGTLSSSLVTITGGGNVGIRTAGPIAKLQVNDTSTSHITIGGQSTDTGVGGWDRWCAHCGDSINGTPNLWLNARDAMKFNSGSFEFGGGNVGIGTANPSNPLTVFTPGGGSPVGAMSVDVNTF
ncbi:MAG: hypothetical protein HY473_00005, partial [Candidatus Sungbacteria bacterium]|nr:hypothetical protein [Candidatus Sungbacteria bacterium]